MGSILMANFVGSWVRAHRAIAFTFFASLCLCVVVSAVPACDRFHRPHGKAANPSRHRGSSHHRAFVPCGPVNAAVGSALPGSRSPPFRAPSAPTVRASSQTRHSHLRTSLLRLRSRIFFCLCATDNDRCTNTAALQTDLHRPHGKAANPSRHRGPSRHCGLFHRAIAPSRLPFSWLRKEIFVRRRHRLIAFAFRVIASSWSIPSRHRVFAFALFVSSRLVVRGFVVASSCFPGHPLGT